MRRAIGSLQTIKQQLAKFEAELSKRDRENAEVRARLKKLEAAISGGTAAK